MLKQYGLLPVLLWYIESYMAKTDILVNFKHHGLNRNFTADITNAAFNIVKEALDNISCNSNNTEVTVQIWIEKELLNIWIDNYDVSSLTSTPPGNIKSIEEQVPALGGKLVIDSSSGSGTRLVVELPLLGNSEEL